MSRMLDLVELKSIVDYVFDEYEHRRVEELLSTAKGSSRISREELPTVLGKAQAAREIKAQLYTQLGLSE